MNHIFAAGFAALILAGQMAHATNPNAQYSTAYQINPAHSGNITFTTPFAVPLKKAWSVDFGGAVSYPIVAEGMVFVSVANSPAGTPLLVALDLQTGKVAWEKAIDSGYLAYDSGRLFFTDFNGPLQAFEAKSGRPLWSTQLPNQYYFNFLPIAAFGSVFAGGDESGTSVYQVDEANGQLGWTQFLDAGGAGATLGNGAIFFSVPCDVPAYDIKTGAVKWNYSTGCDGGGGSVAAFYQGYVFAPGSGGSAGVILKASNGAVVGGLSTQLPAFYGTLSYTATSSGVVAANFKTGDVAWEFGTKETLTGSPIVINGTVFVASTAGHILVLSGSTGKLLQTLYQGVGTGGGYDGSFAALAAGQGYLVAPTGNVLAAYVP
jgi:outer membrane protein assembly factor BamB